MKIKNILVAFALSAFASTAHAGDIGSVDTTYRFVGANDKISVMSFEDPDIKGVSCFLSRAVKGGIKGSLGIAEDTSDASIACRQTGPIEVLRQIAGNDKPTETFSEKRSVFFKKLHVVRFYDKDTSSFVYLTFSDKLVDGSPKNSISAVTPQEVIGGTKIKGDQFLPR